jgi:hypothetical protein
MQIKGVCRSGLCSLSMWGNKISNPSEIKRPMQINGRCVMMSFVLSCSPPHDYLKHVEAFKQSASATSTFKLEQTRSMEDLLLSRPSLPGSRESELDTSYLTKRQLELDETQEHLLALNLQGGLFSTWIHAKTKENEKAARNLLEGFDLSVESALNGFLKYVFGKSGFLVDSYRSQIASGNTAVEANFSRYKGNSGGNAYDNVVSHISECAILQAEANLMMAGSFEGGRGPGIRDFEQRAADRGNGAG